MLDQWFFSRPILMPPVWTILLLAAAEQRGGIIAWNAFPIDEWRIWVGLLSSYCLAGAAYILNQIYDIESDRRNDKLYFLPRGMISIRSAAIQYGLYVFVGLGTGYFLGWGWFFCVSVSVVLGILYSARPFRWKDRPLTSVVANAIGHGALVYYCGFFLAQPQLVPRSLSSLGYTFAVASVYVLTTLPDSIGDRDAGKKTITVTWGAFTATVTAILFLVIAGIFAGINAQWPLLITALAAVPGYVWSMKNHRVINAAIRIPLVVLSFFACLSFWPYFLILAGLFGFTRWYYRRRFDIRYP